MADLAPHELIIKLATQLAKNAERVADPQKLQTLNQAADAVRTAAAQAKAADARVVAANEALGQVKAGDEGDVRAAAAEAATAADNAAEEARQAAVTLNQELTTLIEALPGWSWLPDMVTFAGYLAEKIKRPGVGGDWRVLYTDLPLVKWVLVEEDGILFKTTVQDDTSPFGNRDVIWVDEDASVGMGMGSQSVEARFLTGTFTRAGDFGGAPGGGTMSASTGVFCEARTVGCCTIKSKR